MDEDEVLKGLSEHAVFSLDVLVPGAFDRHGVHLLCCCPLPDPFGVSTPVGADCIVGVAGPPANVVGIDV
jgi:hypothetical protein